MTHAIEPGLLVLHGNRLELLGEAVWTWLQQRPLAPLESEVVLVQSNAAAEWVKMELARQHGICASVRVELPGRFLWRTCRQVLGNAAVPRHSALDKAPLTWRLLRLLPVLLNDPAQAPTFAVLAGFLNQGQGEREWQLAQQIADLFDQYQNYRSDWLQAWAAGQDVLPGVVAASLALPPDQRWQPALWRALLQSLPEAERQTGRAQVQQRLIEGLQAGRAPVRALARRVVVFGMSQLPMQTLQMLAALATRCQVLLAVPNPCRFHWADIIEGRELLQSPQRRQPLRQGRDLAALPLADLHAHSHPLLAAWGRQGRDFVRQLDAFDDALAAQQIGLARVDWFDEGDGTSLLAQVQANIRELLPLAEHPRHAVPEQDRSIVFHIGHSAQRELEILHDQLLHLLAHPPDGEPLQPRDVVVMVPDIEPLSASIRAVFGQYQAHDARHIPFDIADVNQRQHNPLLLALEWLLRLPQQRCGLTELRELLEVPAVAERFGLPADDLPRLSDWLQGAGVRWGLDLAQRSGLGLASCTEQNSLLFGLRRMLLGYASNTTFAGIEPYPEIGGLQAATVGVLAELVERLQHWSQQARCSATPTEWAGHLRNLLADFVSPTSEAERATLVALQQALADWLLACETAAFDLPLRLSVVREAWLGGLDAPGVTRPFRAGGVTFCTLMPLRTIPFQVVCLLGMNDGDYPRRSPRSDFDLMALPGQRRVGDRGRRDDDRQLMLEALLAARRVLYVSWSGRSARNNSEQPPSVLVSQLRDYLQAGWSGAVLAARTTEHPLQPFGRCYFEPHTDAALLTYAREWRAAHLAQRPLAGPTALVANLAAAVEAATPLTLERLARFLKNPVKLYFRERLGVNFADPDEAAADDEDFALDGLSAHGLTQALLQAVLPGLQPDAGALASDLALQQRVAVPLAGLVRAGQLPMAAVGERAAASLSDDLTLLLAAWQRLTAGYPEPADKRALRFVDAQDPTCVLEDWQDGLRSGNGQTVWLEWTASRLCQPKNKKPQPDKLIRPWLHSLAASACALPLPVIVLGRDASITLLPWSQPEAARALQDLLQAWREGQAEPLPLACQTALAELGGQDGAARLAYEGGDHQRGEADEPCLHRVYPDFAALAADGRFAELAQRLFGPLLRCLHERAQVQPHPDADRAAPTEASA